MIDNIFEYYSNDQFLKIDGHDNALLGVDETTMRLCYSKKLIIENLMNDMSEDDAIEFYEFNINGAYVGEKTPILINDYL